MALRPAFSAATCAANGVDLRDPLKPWLPAEDQEMALPWASVMGQDECAQQRFEIDLRSSHLVHRVR
jgi:hypothetical protein